MTDIPDTLDLTDSPYGLAGLLATARDAKLRLTITTTDRITSIGTPVQVHGGEGGLVTLTEGDEVWFVPLAHITNIAPNPADVPVTVHTR